MIISRKEIYGIVAAIVLAIVGHAYVSSVRDTSSAEAVSQMAKQQIQQMREEMKAELATIAQDKRDVQTPQQIVVKLPQYIPNLPVQPVVIPSSDLPNAPGVGTSAPGLSTGGIFFPQADVKPLFDFTADCKTCSISLKEMTHERDLQTQRAEKAEKAMKGGSFFTRVKRNAKWFAIGIGTGAAIGYAAKH